MLTAIAVLVLAFGVVNWILPLAMSFYAARSAPAIVRISPQRLNDSSVSAAAGTKLAYFGYELEVPWTDLEARSTQLFPKNAPTPNRADLHFRSGLRLIVTALPPTEWENNFGREMHLPPKDLEAAFGRDVMNSDYRFLKMVYEFTPSKMDHWSATKSGVSRDELLLVLKSIIPLRAAESGIFYLQNDHFQGFQQGRASPRQDVIGLHMFADDGSIEMMVFQQAYKNSARITQPEINRIVQSLRKTPKENPAAPMTASHARVAQ